MKRKIKLKRIEPTARQDETGTIVREIIPVGRDPKFTPGYKQGDVYRRVYCGKGK